MGELILVLLLIAALVKNPTSTLLWVAGIALVAVIAALGSRKSGKQLSSGAAGRPRVRIDHPHLIDADDSECSVCGSRFSGNRMTCPNCGVRFTDRKTDYGEFDEEEDEWAAWEEEEGW